MNNFLFRCSRNSYNSQYVFRETKTFLAEQLQPLPEQEQKEWLNNIASHIQNQNLITPNVDIQHIELAIKVILLNISMDKLYNAYTHMKWFLNSFRF